MSIEATLATWKLTKEQVTATEKLFLLSCANRAGEDYECWPSLKRLTADTGFDRKTVIKIRQSLIEKKLMEYTGDYKGHSKQIPIMRLTYVKTLLGFLDQEDTSTKIGTSPNSGICTSTKIGTGTSTVFGTLNLKEETKRLKDISASDESPNIASPESLEEEDKNTQADSEKTPAKPNDKIPKSTEQSELKAILKENVFSLPEEVIRDWIANRKKKRLPITSTAWKKINKELAKCKEHGIDPIEAFETFVANGWQSFKLEWFLKDKDKSQDDGKSSSLSPLKNYW